MPTYRVDAILRYTSGLPRDISINTFHVFSEEPLAGEGAANETFDAVQNFYNGANTNFTIRSYLGNVLDRGASKATITLRSIEDDSGAPLFQRNWTLGANASTNQLPLEVACCLSYYGQTPGGVPQGRSRGRIYLGPLNQQAVSNAGTVPSVPATGFITDLTVAAGRLRTELLAAETPWAVYSRAGQDTWLITGGWVDNEWDTQRRRQIDATTRSTWGSPPT